MGPPARRPRAGGLRLHGIRDDRLAGHLELDVVRGGRGSPSAAPGAVESYAAVADLVAHARAPRGLARDVGLDVDADGWLDAPLLRTRIELAALEFGGAFQC